MPALKTFGSGNVSIVAVAAGITIAGAIVLLGYVLQQAAFPDGRAPYPLWYGILEPMLKPLGGVIPGLVAGWLARGSPVVHGALVALGSTIAGSVIALWFFGTISVGVIAIALTVGYLIESITQCIGAIAGAALYRRRAGI